MTGGRLRVDKWLWYARFCKSRSLGTDLAASGRLRCNGVIVTKAHFELAPDDVLTFPLGRHIRVIRVAALGSRRGPAAEARGLYQDLAPPAAETALPPETRGGV
ncbi:MAG: RNA-binding S4 domain-containing protein [Rhodospirillaceae bacterium]